MRRYGRGGVRRVSCLWSRVAACAPPPKTQNVNRTSNVNPQPTEPVLLASEQHSVPRCPVWTPRRNSQHDPEPRGTAIGANRANRGARMTKTAAASTSGHRNPCALRAPADRHVPLCTRNVGFGFAKVRKREPCTAYGRTRPLGTPCVSVPRRHVLKRGASRATDPHISNLARWVGAQVLPQDQGPAGKQLRETPSGLSPDAALARTGTAAPGCGHPVGLSASSASQLPRPVVARRWAVWQWASRRKPEAGTALP